MNPQIIRIRKGAVVYDDAAEDGGVLPPRPPRRRLPLRRRRPGGRSVIAPLIAVAAGIFIVFRVVPHAPSSRSTLSGWQVTLHVSRYSNGLIVGVTFVARSRPATPPEATARVSLRGTTDQVFLAGDLDKSPMTLRGRLMDQAEARVIQAEVTIGTARVTLVAPVPPPLPAAPAPAGN